VTIYKYISRKHVDNFVSRGRVLFRPLRYYRDYEDGQIRGDKTEGIRRFAPPGGLTIQNHSWLGGPLTIHGSAFESSAALDHIYVLCTSTILSEELARCFDADTCIEITDADRFAHLLRLALVRQRKREQIRVISKEVSYYEPEDGPGASWQLPDEIVMSKRKCFSWQAEYRFAFGRKTVFRFGKTSHSCGRPAKTEAGALPNTVRVCSRLEGALYCTQLQ
jgi:hypothetical protein